MITQSGTVTKWDRKQLLKSNCKVWQRFIEKCVVCYKVRLVLQSSIEVCYKVCQVLHSASGITECDSLFFTNFVVVTKCARYTKCDRPYYKVHQELQSVTVISKWNVTEAFQTSLNKLVLEAKSITCSTIKENLFLYYREFSAFAIVVIVQNIFKKRSASQRNTACKRNH